MTKSIVGTWRLVKGYATAPDGTALPPPYGGEKGMGRVTFNADGRMMAVLCDGRSEMPAGMAREYNSYCGNYTFDGKRLVTKVDACSDPARLSSDQIRDVRFEGDFMILRPPVRDIGGKATQRELWWEKISDA
ncbi:MAG TPA: lipocalin-like domain-containing protein [Hyphomicrobiaceae bacterium]|nr:lipocalin-like domain-containing protein [Hyphomicrobiaceae bacterium]